MKKGDVILTPFPFTDLTSSKVRPAVVISLNKKGTDVIICFISSVIDYELTESDLLIKDTDKNFGKAGLKVSSVIKADKIATIDSKIIIGKLGELSDELVNELNVKLRRIIGL
jgi:mRNA interferase MazF